MRVLLFAESFLPHINGVTNSVLHTLRHLERRGHEAIVVAPQPDRATSMPRSVHGAPVVAVPSIPAPGYPQVRVAVVGRRRLDAIVQRFRPDVTHLASPFVLGWQGLCAAHRADVPTVAVYQTDLPGYAARYGVPGAEQALTRHLTRLHGRATLNLAPSRAALDDLERIGVPRLAQWGRGVDTDRFTPSRRSDRVRGELAPSGEVVVGYVGRLAPEKQVGDLRALSGMPSIRLVIVGDGPARPELEQQLPDATFLGFKGGDELAEIVASFDVFVHPGEYETFCQTVQEALASGVPVVATGRGGPVDLVASSRTGWLYRPGDLDDLRSRVADLAGDGAKRAAFSVAAAASVADRSWTAICDQLIGHYEAAAASVRTVTARDAAPAVSPLEAAHPATPAQPATWSRYVALGDSLTEGLCDTSRQPEGQYRGWADRLASLIAHDNLASRVDYANLAVRSKRIDEVIAQQVPVAIRMRPALVSILVGANDLVRLRAAPTALADRVGAAVAALTATGATVLVMGVFAPPYAGLVTLRARIRRFNQRLAAHCEQHGALFVDFAADPVAADLTSWSDDRVHLSSRGHRALCYRAAAHLGIRGARELGALDQAMHEPAPPSLEPWSSTPQWMWVHLRPWAARRLLGRRAGDGREPKHVEPVEVIWRTAGADAIASLPPVNPPVPPKSEPAREHARAAPEHARAEHEGRA